MGRSPKKVVSVCSWMAVEYNVLLMVVRMVASHLLIRIIIPPKLLITTTFMHVNIIETDMTEKLQKPIQSASDDNTKCLCLGDVCKPSGCEHQSG